MNQTTFQNTSVTYKALLDHLKQQLPKEEFLYNFPEVSEARVDEFIKVHLTFNEFHKQANEITRSQQGLPAKKGKANYEGQIKHVIELANNLIRDLESYRYKIQGSEYFRTVVGQLDNLRKGCSKVITNPYVQTLGIVPETDY